MKYNDCKQQNKRLKSRSQHTLFVTVIRANLKAESDFSNLKAESDFSNLKAESDLARYY